MGLATQLIRAAIEAGAPTFVRDLRDEHLNEDEFPVVNFVKNHLRQYGQLPSLVTLSENGFNIGRVRETAAYYKDEIKNRYLYRIINDRHPQLVAAMRIKDSLACIEIVREMATLGGSSLSSVNYVSITEEATKVLEDYEYAKAHPGLRGITYGWPTMDDLTLGMHPGDLDVIAGRAGVGKSYLLQEGAYSAWSKGHGIAIVTMEMPAQQFATRWVARHSGINPRMIRGGELSRWGESRLRQTIVDIQQSSAPVHIMSGDFNKGVDGVEGMIRQLDAEALYIDAAYLLSPSSKKRTNSRWEEIAQLVRELKQLGLSMKRPISATFQFNRNVKSKSQKDLDLGDIGGSDAIPQDASIVRGIKEGRPPFQKTRRYIQFMKNREGEVKDFEVNFRHYPLNFSEVSESQEMTNVGWMV